ncbi:hypothetical protein LUR56_33325 [Streptomyces sp. MT29]|nr:hypothetical protein [Streptomyces sp. MT29]
MHFVAQAPQQGAQRAAELDEFAVAFYERAIGRGEFDPLRIAEELGAPPRYAEHAVGVLRELRLVKPAESRADRLVAVSPEAAQMELLVPLEREILDSRHRLAGFKGQLSAFAAAFERQSRTRAEPVVITGDQDEIELRLLAPPRAAPPRSWSCSPAWPARPANCAWPARWCWRRCGAALAGGSSTPTPPAATRAPAPTSANSCPRAVRCAPPRR